MDLSNFIFDSLTQYGEHYNSERAIPDIYSGLKPVQRKLLYTMYLLKLKSDGKYAKALTIQGRTSSFYQHGDAALAGALIRMGQPFKMGTNLIDGRGNWGSQSSLYIPDAGAAAIRYLEARLTPLAEELLNSVKMNLVPMKLSFDNTQNEPEHLWLNVPGFLLFAQKGIGVGTATNYFSFTPKSVKAFTKKVVQAGGKVEKEFLSVLKPLFWQSPTIINKSDFVDILWGGTNKKSLRIQGTCTKNGNTIEISNFPQSLCPKTLLDEIQKIAETDPNHIFNNISESYDSSKKQNGKELVVLDLVCRRGTDLDALVAELYRKTSLETTATYGLTLVDTDGKARKFTLPQAMEKWYGLYVEKTKLKLSNEKSELSDNAEVLQGLLMALADIDRIIELIKSSETVKVATDKLVSLGYSIAQAEAILNTKLAKLANLEQSKLQEKLNAISLRIAEIEGLLLNPESELLAQIAATSENYDSVPETMQIDATTKKIKQTKELYVKLSNNKVTCFDKNIKGTLVLSEKSPLYFCVDNAVVPVKVADKSKIPDSATAIFNAQSEGILISIAKNGYIKATTIKSAQSDRKATLVNNLNVTTLLVAATSKIKLTFDDKTTITLNVAEVTPTGRGTKGRKLYKKQITGIKVL